YNALFYLESRGNETAKLITPELDLKDIIKPELVFYHAQVERMIDTNENYVNDELRIYFKENKDSTWKMLEEFTDPVNQWTKRNILLPDSALTETFYIAFEGKTNIGYGTCVDTVNIIETGIEPKSIEDISYHQASDGFVPTRSNNNPILRIDFEVKGNDGEITLDSLSFESLNTDDSNIKENGVKVFATDDQKFKEPVLIANGKNFSNSTISFENLNHELKRGITSVWLTYDIKDDPSHNSHGNILDAKISDNSILINNSSTYPLTDKSPDGERQIYESIYYEDFESDANWSLTGEFEIDQPQGLGGSSGSPDPEYASSGDSVLGTDLTGLGGYPGDYEPGLETKEYQAISPMLDCYYYQDMYLLFDQWLNMDDASNDKAYIEISKDNGETWSTLWENSALKTTSVWEERNFSLENHINRDDSVKIRFSLGKTNSYFQFSGWNIDNLVIAGDYIAQDVGVSKLVAPMDGCGHTSEEDIIVEVENFGGDPTEDTIPLYYSIDGGQTKVRDTIYQSIPVDESITHTFSTPADLSKPELYPLEIKTTLDSDEASENDKLKHDLLVLPTYTPPYSEDFEETPHYFWQVDEENGTWEYGTPSGTLIDSAASGSNVWGTNISGTYPNTDSTFLESPCFNLEGLRNPVFEVKIFSDFQEGKDGMALHYSLDDGTTWNIVTEKDSFDWNWYNAEYIEALETAGWDTTSNDWMVSKVLLPEKIIGATQVKFRFLMESDSSTTYEGAAIDDIRIYEAPPDVAVDSLVFPTTQCELSDSVQTEIYVSNTGIDTLFAGQEIPLRMEFNSDPVIKDTLELSDYLAPGDSVLFAFDKTVDMSDSGDYAFKVYSTLEDDPYFYDSINNDTITDTIAVQGMPNYDIGDVIGMEGSIDTTLDAGAGYNTYLWSSDQWSSDSTDRTVHITEEGWYTVTVTNDTGCTATDSVKVVSSQVNTGVTNINTTLSDSCVREIPTELETEITNMGLSDFQSGDSIPMAYQVNNRDPVHDTLWLESALNQDESVNFTFTDSIDISEAGSYTIKAYTNFPEDYDHSNDTTQATVNTWGTPDTELRYDTLLTGQADSLTLDAGTAFDTLSYEWQDGSTEQTFDITHNR
ncbi:MAG: hypothetical protein ACLFM7_14070, partial [Bacteroidales bacterium]